MEIALKTTVGAQQNLHKQMKAHGQSTMHVSR